MHDQFIKFFKKTKEPLGYLSDLSTLIIVLYSIFLSILLFFNSPTIESIKNNFQGINIFIKFIIGLLLFIIFVYLINNIYKKSKFILETSKLSSNIEKELVNQQSSLLIRNYQNIVPTTTIIKEIFRELETIAKRWSPDVYLAEHRLDIWVKRNQINMDMTGEFFSKKKRASIKLTTTGMKVPKNYSINPNQINYDESRAETKPFFIEVKWRMFIVEALERIESEIAGHEFYLSVSSWILFSIRFYLDPGFTPCKTFTFFLRDGVMFKDVFLKDKIAKL